MGHYPLLRTKLYIPPARPEVVSRPRLVERLKAGLHHKLTLVSAPAGFGKTTLVGEWVHNVGAPGHVGVHGPAPLRVAWLSLDEGDDDLSRFLAYLIAALQTIEASIGKGLSSALQSTGVADASKAPPAEAVLTSLINDVATLRNRTILVLDDYHLIEALE
ncbi:MAG: hypothetical protein PVF47_13595, partial [Anaerolineae bacterium]